MLDINKLSYKIFVSQSSIYERNFTQVEYEAISAAYGTSMRTASEIDLSKASNNLRIIYTKYTYIHSYTKVNCTFEHCIGQVYCVHPIHLPSTSSLYVVMCI